ncbi:nucleoid-associated protein [Brucella anthropi]|uniref:Nucleoid-associated protein AB664_07830 n=1 Tax=Brucella anthropi TaxID=529 RepID=A0A656Z5K6_BRUAN|nr:nucleoid-associated protein [Brucella anthropi]
MRDMMGMMKQAKELQAKMKVMQDEIANLEATASSGGGLVTVTLSGKGTLSALRIDPSLAKEDEVEILEDLSLQPITMPRQSSKLKWAEKTQSLTAGLPIPPGFKLPF